MKFLAALLICTPLALFALNGASDIGIGAKAKGMGGVGLALPQDAFAGAINPAGLFCVGNRIDVGVGYTALRGDNDNRSLSGSPITGLNGPLVSSHLWFPDIGTALRCGCNQSFGFTAYVKGATLVKYKRILYFDPGQGLPSRYNSYTIFLTPSWSYRINPCLSFGVAINGIIHRHRNNVNQGNPSAAPNIGSQFVGKGKIGITGGVNVKLGLLLMPTDSLRIGMTYQSGSAMTRTKLYIGQWALRSTWAWPQEMGIGASYCFCNCLRLAIDWNYLYWHDSQGYGNRTFNPEGRAGSEAGSGMSWVNQTVWKLGLAWTRRCVTLRVGYNFGNTPLVPQGAYVNPLNIACVENHVTAGASYRTCLGELSAYYYRGFQKSILGQGPSFIGGSAYAGNVSAHQHGFGIAYGLCW